MHWREAEIHIGHFASLSQGMHIIHSHSYVRAN
uniref:Uncharacterized protein n=1 Tax=Anguilla anguilla TaxID=7936 RepID=A0A0E9VVQ2_ANGAN